MKRLIAALWLLVASSAHAQTPDPSGRWEGSVEAPGISVPLIVDLARNTAGELQAAITLPAEKISGLPIKATVEGRAIKLLARADQGIVGVLSEDGTSIDAEFQAGPITLPFALKRTGTAQLPPPIRLAAVSRELEGKWRGMLSAAGINQEIVLTLLNQPDGTATGVVVNVNQGGLEVPVSAVTQTGATVALEIRALGASFTGTLSDDRSEIVGTTTQGALTSALTFHREPVQTK